MVTRSQARSGQADQGNSGTMSNNPGEPSMQELLAIIRQQNESLVNQAAALQQIRAQQQQAEQEANQAKQAELLAKQQLEDEVAAVEGAGGIYGYESGRVLTQPERDFHSLLLGFGLNRETADEILRQGLTGVEVLRHITSEKLKSIIYNITRNKSPHCPDKEKVFLGAAFEDKMTTLISWIQFQRVTGGDMTAKAWVEDPNASSKTIERLQYYREIKASEATEDISLPEPLTEMKKFRDFREHLLTYLRTKRGAANVPLVYTIRDEDDVSDNERAGTVGSGAGHMYRNWDDYSIRCTVLDGTHWDSDNTSLWQILSRLVRDGPGWDYIRSYEKIGDGDGRGAYKSLTSQAFQYTNVRIIRDEARTNLRNLKYSGPSRGWNYDKYVRSWLKNIKTLKEFDDCPKEETLVSDFCAGITDPRLDAACSFALQEGSEYVDNFEKTQKYFTTVLAIAQRREAKNNKDRRVSSVRGKGGNSNKENHAFTGKLEAKSYSPKEWHSMTPDQKETVRKLRKESATTNKRNASAISAGEKDSDAKDAGNQFGSNVHKKKKKDQ